METSYVATIGFFDGVHLGHRHLLRQVIEVAQAYNLTSMVVTFAQLPRKVVNHDSCRYSLLTTTEEKLSLLKMVGISHCEVMDFTPELASLTAYDFMRLLRNKYHVHALLIGYDHRFGHNRSEGFEDYVNYGKELGDRKSVV